MEFKVSFECEKRSSEQNVTYCNSGPHQNHRRSRRSRHTPSGWKCSDGSRIQTGWMYKTCLQERVGSILQSLLHLSCVFPSAVGSPKKNSLAFFSFSFCYDLCVFKIKIGVLEDNFAEDWPQCVSSAPFSQSFSLSQVQLIGMHRPLGQAKKLTGHLSFLLSATQQRKKENIIKNLW